MKRQTLFGLATALLLTACSKDVDPVTPVNSDGSATFTLNLPTPLGTRAFGTGLVADDLEIAIFDAETGDLITVPTDTNPESFNNSNQTTVKLSFANGKNYKVAFFAHKKDQNVYTFDATEKTITVNYDAMTDHNVTDYDCFYAIEETGVVAGPFNKEVTLYRPMAQINWGTSDINEVSVVSLYGEEAAKLVSKATVKDAYTTLDMFTGDVVKDKTVDVALNYLARPDNTEHVFPAGAAYEYLSAYYLLAPKSGDVIDLKLEIAEDAAATEARSTLEPTFVPYQANYRTNIYGALLTSDADITIVIKPAYFNDDKYGIIDGQSYVKVSDAKELKAALASEGKTDVIILANDIELDEADLAMVADKEATIDLGGNKLSAASAQANNMIEVTGALTMKNGSVAYTYTGEELANGNYVALFNVTAGGVLNLDGVTATNESASDNAFVVYLDNQDGEVTLNVDKSALVANHVPVCIVNSGNAMNNFAAQGSTLQGGDYGLWISNYTAEDFGSQEEANAHKALLNLDIYNEVYTLGNTILPYRNSIRYGSANALVGDDCGIVKSVSEDGSVVTVGSLVDNGTIYWRGFVGAEGNTTITKVVVEEGISVLFDRTFRQFKALETVELPSTLTVLGAEGTGVFQSCSALKNVVIPESVTKIGKGAFHECASLSSINIPAGVTRIEQDVFRATGLTSVEFHEGVTYFGAQAFRDCKSLTKVVINAPSFTVESNTFLNAAAPYPSLTIYVANEEMKAYLSEQVKSNKNITVVAPGIVDTPEDLSAALNAGERVALGSDLALPERVFIKNADFYLNGNGHTITLSEEYDITAGKNYHAPIDISGGKGTITNIVFDGMKGRGVIHTVYSDVTISNCTVQNGNHLVEGTKQGIFRLLGKSTVSNCTFKNNTCYMAVSFNIDGNNNDDEQYQTLENCVFENNTCSQTGVVYYAQGAGATIKDNKFISNTVNGANCATLYMGFQPNLTITDNVFTNNTVTCNSRRSAGALMIGNNVVVKNNAFVGNKVIGPATGNDVCASVYYSSIDLSGNYWGGEAPVQDVNYYVEYETPNQCIINDYLTSYNF